MPNQKSDTSDKTAIDIATLLHAGFTQSELTSWSNCHEQWYRGYNQRLRRKGVLNWAYIYGDAMHDSLESFYRNMDGTYELATLQIPEDAMMLAEDELKERYFTELLPRQMERYAKYYANDFENWQIDAAEQIVTVEYEGIKFTGKIDLLICEDDFHGPLDHKTMGAFSPEIFAGYNFRFQFLFYAWLVWKKTGIRPTCIWWNGIKKPQLKQGKNESFESFMVRIEGDMRLEPEKYMKRQKLPIEEDYHLDHFEKRILGPKLSSLKTLTDATTSGIILESLARDMNTSNCVKYGKPCEFLALCQHGFKQEGLSYSARGSKHEELESE